VYEIVRKMRRPIMVGQGMIQIKIFAVQANQHFFAEERYDPERFEQNLMAVFLAFEERGADQTQSS
jgi:hypothetical protein